MTMTADYPTQSVTDPTERVGKIAAAPPLARDIPIIPSAELDPLGTVGKYTYHRLRRGDGEVRIGSRYYPPSATRATAFVSESVGGIKAGLIGGGTTTIGGGAELLHEAWLEPAGTYRRELERVEQLRNPPPKPIVPVLVGPHVDEVRRRLAARGYRWQARDGRVVLATNRHPLNDDLALARAYAPLMAGSASCLMCKRPAEYVAEVNAPLCGEHATAEVR